VSGICGPKCVDDATAEQMVADFNERFGHTMKPYAAETPYGVPAPVDQRQARRTREAVKTLCVDFDGVLHGYTSPWSGADVIPDPPVPGAIAFLSAASERFKVAVFSARSHQPGGIDAMKRWLTEHGLLSGVLAKLSFPTEKPQAVVYLDDRGWRFDGVFPSLDEIDKFHPWNRRPR